MTVRLRNGLQLDLRVVPERSYGAALQYFTGSKEHSILLRRRAQERGLKINEYGVFRGETAVAGATEEEVYKAVDLPWIPPELREARGEIGLAQQKRLPKLLELDDLRGDLHMHTTVTDGRASLEEMALAAKKRATATDGTLPTHGPLFVALLAGVVLLVGLLNYVPALALGPVVEHLVLTTR